MGKDRTQSGGEPFEPGWEPVEAWLIRADGSVESVRAASRKPPRLAVVASAQSGDRRRLRRFESGAPCGRVVDLAC